MTLETFALATLASRSMPLDDNLMRNVEMAAVISDALQARGDVGTQRLMPGAGLWLNSRRGTLSATVLADRSIVQTDSDELLPIDQFPLLRDALGSLLGGWPEDFAAELCVLFVAQGNRHSAPGTKVLSTTSGRVGPHVRWGSGRQGFLTAGHVAPTIGAGVTDANGVSLGTVLWSNDPALAPSTNGDLDAALVAFGPAYRAATGRSPIIAGAGDMLTVASTRQQAAVLGFFDHLRFGGAQACYAQCYATETKITILGDSGGLVEARGDVVGMVLGGFIRRDMTVVQSVGYQLSEIRRRSGHMITL
jgi:hypothetical protein